MAQSRAEKNRKARQTYYQREYERLISQGKKLYNSMNLGSVFGPETPTFEEILNYAGTRSGLKRPTKKSLKALRRVSTEKGILWGVEKTLPKKSSSEARVNIEALRSEEQKSREAVDKANKTVKKHYKNIASDVPDLTPKMQSSLTYGIMGPIASMQAQLRYYRNYTMQIIKQYANKHNLSFRQAEREHRYNTAYECAVDCLDRIADVLTSGDYDRIEFLSLKCQDFFDSEGEVTLPELYENGPQLRPRLWAEAVNAVKEGSEGPKEEEPKPYELTGDYFEDFSELF